MSDRLTSQRKWRDSHNALALLADLTEAAFRIVANNDKWDRHIATLDRSVEIARNAGSLDKFIKAEPVRLLAREADVLTPKIKKLTEKLVAPFVIVMVGHAAVAMLRGAKLIALQHDPDSHALHAYLHPGDSLDFLNSSIELQAQNLEKLGGDMQGVSALEAHWRFIDRTRGRGSANLGFAFEAVWATGDRNAAYALLKKPKVG